MATVSFEIEKSERIANSEFGMYEKTDLVELWTIHYRPRKYFVDTAENGSFKVAMFGIQYWQLFMKLVEAFNIGMDP